MQPLKRFTQCGSLTMLFAVFIVLFGVSSTALTTFGKSNQNTPAPTLPPMKGRLCHSQSDCSYAPQTTCVKDPEDKQMRCLCGDNKGPVGTYCSAKNKGLRHLCQTSPNCYVGMICIKDNSTHISTSTSTSTSTSLTSTSSFGNKQPINNTITKICICNEEAGYYERDFHCSGAIRIFTGILVPLMALMIGTILAKKPATY